jgi:hypothetical protein
MKSEEQRRTSPRAMHAATASASYRHQQTPPVLPGGGLQVRSEHMLRPPAIHQAPVFPFQNLRAEPNRARTIQAIDHRPPSTIMSIFRLCHRTNTAAHYLCARYCAAAACGAVCSGGR